VTERRGPESRESSAAGGTPERRPRRRANDVLAAWVAFVRRHAGLVALVALGSGALTLRYAASTLTIDTDRDAMLDPELPFRRDAERLREAFPNLSDVLVLVIDADVPEHARAAALELAERLRARAELFEDVQVPRAEPLLEQASLLFLSDAELARLAERLEQVQPILGRLSRDPTPRALFELLAQAYEASAERTLPLDRVARSIADALAALRAGEPGVVSWQELLTPDDALAEAGGDRRFDPCRQIVLARVRPDFGRLFPAGAAIDFVRDLRDELGWHADAPTSLAITGQPAMAHEELETVRRGSRTIGVLVVLMVGAALALGLRSWRLVVASLVTLAVGLAWTAGFAALAIGHLNLISVAFAVLFLGLGADFAIHFGLRYREALDAEDDAATAWTATARDVGGSLFVCALTTALGFFAFVPTAYAGVSELGWIAGAGILIAFVVTVSVLPAVLTLLPLRAGGAPPAPAWLGRWTTRRARGIRIGAWVVGALALVVLPGVRFERNPLGLRDPDAESVATFRDLLSESATPPWSVNVLAADADEAAGIARAWSELESVGRVVRLESFVPNEQEAKLERLFDLSLALGDVELRSAVGPGPPSEERAALAELRRALDEHLARVSEDAATQDDAAARALRDEVAALEGAWGDDVAGEVADRLLGTLGSNLTRLGRALVYEGHDVDDLPADLRARWVAPDGSRRVEAFSATDLDEVAALRRFADDVRRVAPGASGSPVMIVESGDVVVRAFQQAFAIALAATIVVLGLLLRRARDVTLVLVPLLLAAAATTATLVLLDEPFNFANVIGLPLLLGIGVDSGVHVLHRARATGGDPLASSTQRAVLYSALTTLASFANLSLSPHPGTASMGRILAIGVAFTLLATLVVLPAHLAAERRTSGA